MLRPVVAQRVDFTPILPFTHVHSLLVNQAGLLDVGELRPARAPVDVAVLAQGLRPIYDVDCVDDKKGRS